MSDVVSRQIRQSVPEVCTLDCLRVGRVKFPKRVLKGLIEGRPLQLGGDTTRKSN